ncbi:Potassium channel [Cadophora gregata]|uniref:Potassium channel n=1 Tax=Cadophora gregata TaxID=51156 RepID=UPI0026DCEF85|nr:Potassium channel [Cadophora gregata]KAK0129152.1 Potassium channel [Cadophora gregata]
MASSSSETRQDPAPNGSPGSRNGSTTPVMNDMATLEKTDTILTFGKFKLRGKTDDLPQDWWFASTAIPLLAATIGPLANVLSIAALVSKWRVKLPDNGQLPGGLDALGTNIPDPKWEIILNAISLGCGFFGNFCLLLNFTQRIRYIIALPATIISWYFATGILIAITAAMNQYVPPIRPGETYSQGFWHAIIAAVLYLIGSMILMINMLGYFLGHYPQHFELDDDQRTLILQTMMFFFWLAGGAAVFSKVCGFSYADALYFCDVTVLTVGFGDVVANNSAGRGLVFPYSVIGIIFLGLMINSIRKFASGMSKDNVIKKHTLNERARTFSRTVTSEKELRERLGLPPKRENTDFRRQTRTPSNLEPIRRASLDQYGHFNVQGKNITFKEHKSKAPAQGGGRGGAGRNHRPKPPLSRDAKIQQRAAGKEPHIRRASRREKLIMLKEEKDRFDAMRDIQAHTNRFKQYYALAWSVFAFGILWCLGALGFMYAERRIQNLSYFDALYFCYVSLLTIGYGDFSPRSNAGKPLFIVWSLVAVPTMTILVSDMGNTVVSAINRGTFTLADWTVMPKEGVWHDFVLKHPKLEDWLERRTKKMEEKKRIEEGFTVQNPDDEEAETGNAEEDVVRVPTLDKLAEEPPTVTEHDLARKLAIAIKRTANDLRSETPKKYSYEEWVEFTRLIRFSSSKRPEDVDEEEEEQGLIEWDWIGEDSPMLADVSESEWILDRLCESLNRYTRKQARDTKRHNLEHSKTSTIHSPEHLQLTSESSRKRQALYHDHHIESYPAHPGPRTPGAHSRQYSHELKTPVLSRGPSGDEVFRIGHESERDGDEERDAVEGSSRESGITAVVS